MQRVRPGLSVSRRCSRLPMVRKTFASTPCCRAVRTLQWVGLLLTLQKPLRLWKICMPSNVLRDQKKLPNLHCISLQIYQVSPLVQRSSPTVVCPSIGHDGRPHLSLLQKGGRKMTTVTYSTVFEHTADQVWAVIRDFNSYPAWVASVTQSHIEGGKSGDSVGAIRDFVEYGVHIRQRLVARSDVD